jgi:transmembrane sensor
VPEPRRPLLGPLRELDAELRRSPLSAEADARLRALVDGTRAPARRRSLALPIGAALAAAAAVLLLLVLRPFGPEPARPTLGGFTLIAGHAVAQSEGDAIRCESLHCALAVEALGANLRVERATRVRRRPGSAIELVGGAATVIVWRRPEGAPPVRLLVSHGAIEVLGTEFELRQEESGGWVRLGEGKIRFRAVDGREVLLAPGDRLAWPLPPPERGARDAGPAPAADASPRAPQPRRDAGRPLTASQAESLLDEVERLRSQGRYAEVARRLRDALPRVGDAATRERFSFELGTVLGQQLRATSEACAHWRRHLRRFGASRYGPEIRAAQRELACPE